MPENEKEPPKPKPLEVDKGSVATSTFISKSIEETVQLSGEVYATLSKKKSEDKNKEK